MSATLMETSRPEDGKVRLALLGAAHLPSIVALAQKVQLVAVYSRSSKTVNSFLDRASSALSASHPSIEAYSDETPGATLDELLSRKDIDAVLVCLPITVQPQVIVKALESGKHVLSEKPLAQDVTVGVELLSRWEKDFEPKGLKWQVGEQYRHETAVLEASKLVRSGGIGRVAFFSVSQLGYITPPEEAHNAYLETEWRKNPVHQGGFLLDGGVHPASWLMSILPQPANKVVSLSAHSALIQPHLFPADTLMSTMKTQDGAVGRFEMSFSCKDAARRCNEIFVQGSEGSITLSVKVSDEKNDAKRKWDLAHSVHGGGGNKKSYVGDGLELEVERFVDSIRYDVWGIPDAKERAAEVRLGHPREAIRDLVLLEAMLNSAQAEGKSVRLDDLYSDF